MGCEADEPDMPQMHGASIDITSPNLVPPQAMLSLFNALLNERWIGMFRKHYEAVKAALARE